MDRKSLVKKALSFKNPERVPVMFEEKFQNDSDILNPYISASKKWKPEMKPWGIENKPGKYIDEWGSIWEVKRIDEMGRIIKYPLKDLNDLKNYKFPSHKDEGRFDDVFKLLENDDSIDKYVLYWTFCTLFERLHMLHGFSETLIDLINNDKRIEYVLDKILDFQVNLIESAKDKKIPIDGIGIGDDWGTELGLFINPMIWKRVFKKRYKEIIDCCHRCGYEVWLHVDGKIDEIFADFVEIGLDAINLMSPDLFDVDYLETKYKGKITFFSSIDHQDTIASGDEKKIRSEVELVLDKFGSDKGGIILYFCDGNASALGVDIERQKMIKEIIKDYKYYYKD